MKKYGNKILKVYREYNMADRINSIEDLEQMKAAAASQGTTIPNYNEWSQILSDLEEAGVKSTGSYSTDKALHAEIERQITQYIEENKIQETQKQQQTQDEQPRKNTETDNEQALKATVANGTSSTIMADYMKYYHMLM